MQVEAYQLRQMLTDAAEIGAKNALIEAGLLRRQITKAQAYRTYGRMATDKWIREGLIRPVRNKRNLMIDRAQIEIVSKTLKT